MLRNKDPGHAHASSDTHRGDSDSLVLAAQLRQSSNNLASSGAAQRVTQCDRSTPGIDLALIKTQFVNTVDALDSH